MAVSGKTPDDSASVTVRPTKIALQQERDARLTKALRDNLGRRKTQIRARAETTAPDDPETASD